MKTWASALGVVALTVAGMPAVENVDTLKVPTFGQGQHFSGDYERLVDIILRR